MSNKREDKTMKLVAKCALMPKRRFPEFREAGEWMPKAIGSVCNTYSGGTPATTQKEFYGGDIPFIRSAEIGKENTELFLTPEGLSNSAAKLVAKGDVLVALYGANSGDVALAKIDGAINQAILCLKSGDSNAFIYQYLSHIKNWIISTYIQGGQGNLSGEIVKSIELGFPTPDEQQKIADCLSSIDELVTLEAQKLDTLKAHKKGLMQQLFPAEGEALPKLRFPEFRDTDVWINKQLCEVADVNASGDLDSENFSPIMTDEHIYPIYSNSVSQEGLYGYCTYPKYQKDTVTITARGTLGVAFYRDHDYVGIGRLLILSNLKNVVPYFLQEIWNYSAMMPLENGGIPQLTAIKARAVELNMPEKKEQQKIADCLSSIDELVTLEAQKLDTLKAHKKGLMQQLFPALEEVQG